MKQVAAQRTLHASVDDAWAVIADLGAYADVAGGLRSVDLQEGPARGEGARRDCRTVRNAAWTERCTEWDKPRFVMQSENTGDGLPFSELRSTFSVASSGESVTLRAEFAYTPRLWLLGPLADVLHARKAMTVFAEGVVEGWMERLRERQLAYKPTIAAMLRRKDGDVITVLPEHSIADAAKVLSRHGIGCVIVARSVSQVEGLVSERDIVRAVAQEGAAVLQQPVSKIMTRKLFVCAPEHDVFYAMACMTDRRIRHLPVMDDGTLVGIISIGDVVKERIYALETESETMREYIAAREWGHQHGSEPESTAFGTPIGP